ncbi:MAG: DNA recombination protein RmuC [Bacillota bacterium]
MTDLWLIIAAAAGIINIILLIVLISGSSGRKLIMLEGKLDAIEKTQGRIDQSVRGEISRFREEMSLNGRSQYEMVFNQLSTLLQSNENKLEKMRNVLEDRLKYLQEDNSRKLEQMRATVDEKLHMTLEQRLGESFRLVSDRLEAVHKGLGEMQSLAAGVGDLKRVLTNVKTRGTWGEIQLDSILEQILTPEQYGKNVCTRKNGTERVEFALRLPGRDDNTEQIWLPIDSKFPQEDYQRLIDAQERADTAAVDEASRQLEIRVKASAKDIRDKYIDPPNTTDFGIMFLPTEGLYAEVLRRPGLCEQLQLEYRVVVAGPMTLIALLNSLQMGFKTLAIEKRSSEVWALLGAVKTEFGKFGVILDKTQKKLQEASNTIESAARKTRNIQRKLKNVQELSANDASNLLENEINSYGESFNEAEDALDIADDEACCTETDI